MKVRLPITILHNGQYVAPGTEVDLPEAEAKSMISRFGTCPVDETLSAADLASIDTLNTMHALHHG